MLARCQSHRDRDCDDQCPTRSWLLLLARIECFCSLSDAFDAVRSTVLSATPGSISMTDHDYFIALCQQKRVTLDTDAWDESVASHFHDVMEALTRTVRTQPGQSAGPGAGGHGGPVAV
jgi:hypothetical protein